MKSLSRFFGVCILALSAVSPHAVAAAVDGTKISSDGFTEVSFDSNDPIGTLSFGASVAYASTVNSLTFNGMTIAPTTGMISVEPLGLRLSVGQTYIFSGPSLNVSDFYFDGDNIYDNYLKFGYGASASAALTSLMSNTYDMRNSSNFLTVNELTGGLSNSVGTYIAMASENFASNPYPLFLGQVFYIVATPPVPEPSTAMLMVAGLAASIVMANRRRRATMV